MELCGFAQHQGVGSIYRSTHSRRRSRRWRHGSKSRSSDAASLPILFAPRSCPERHDFIRALQVTDISQRIQQASGVSMLDQFGEAVRRGVEMWARVAEQTAEPLKRLQSWFERNDAQIKGVLEGLARYVEAQRERDECSVPFVERHGWPLPVWLIEFRQFSELVAMVDEPKREVSRGVKHAFRAGTRLRREADGLLLDAPHLASRRPLVKQALAAMRRDEWYLVINALLPLVEGLLVDVAWPAEERPEKTSWRPAFNAAQEEIGDFRRDVAVSTLETLLVRVGAGSAIFERFYARRYGIPGEPRALNRHAILHGAARRYGTAENALSSISS